MATKPMRIGVIGYGYWGPNLVRNLMELPGADLIAVADLKCERLAWIGTVYPKVIATQDYRSLYDLDLDGVVIATPPPTHHPIAQDMLNHGLSVLVEKPLALKSEHAEELIKLAEEKGQVLMVGHTFVYNPAVTALKELISSGELGELRYLDAARLSLGLYQHDLNVLWDLAPHDISIILHLLGEDPVSVRATGASCIQGSVEDVVYITFQFPSGLMAHIHVSWLDPCKVRRVTVVGSRKMVVYNDVAPNEKLRIYDKGVECPPYTDSFADFQYAYRYGDIIIPNIQFTEPLRLECAHFVDCMAHGKRPITDGYNGLKVVEIIEAAQRSLRNGGALEEIDYVMAARSVMEAV